MAYLALYRVWRPQTFHDIIGQRHVTQTLQNALKNKRVAHAYLFNGPRGTGKTSAAKIMAKAVNCAEGPAPEPCNHCKNCKGITEGQVVDVVEIDAASNRGVEEIRDLREKVKYAPTEARYKVYIIDEVHMLTTEAFNALLKTLEEPPEHVIFILATTEPHKLPLTIISRCQRFDFRRISVEEIAQQLRMICEANQIQAEDHALAMIARVAEGGMRDALSLLDQVLSFGDKAVAMDDVLAVTGAVSYTYLSRMVQFIHEKDIKNLLDLTDELISEGKDPERLLEDLIHYYRDLLLYKSASELSEVRERMMVDDQFQPLTEKYEQEKLYRIIETVNQSQAEMKWGNHQRIMLEVALIKLCRMKEKSESPMSVEKLAPLLGRIQRLEERLQQQGIRKDKGESAPVSSIDKIKPTGRENQSSGGSSRSGPIHKVVKNASEKHLTELRNQWNEILKVIKDQRIQVHAWLIDGTPAVADGDHVVVAFKNEIHRETTEKPSHREFIEDSIQSVSGRKVRLLTVMENEWRQLSESAKQTSSASDKDEQDPFIEEAIKLAGEDLIEFKD